MKHTLISAFLSAAALTASASGSLDVHGTVFRVDTASHYYVGPGVTQTHLVFTNEGRRMDIFAATLDKNDSSYRPTATARVEIARDKCRGTEEISKIGERKSGGDRQMLTAVNGDFFNMVDPSLPHWGWPNNGTVIDGVIASSVMAPQYHFVAMMIADDGVWIDDASGMHYRLRSTDGSADIAVSDVNVCYPAGGQLHMFNRYIGESTGLPAGERQLVLRLAEGEQWAVNRPVRFVVVDSWSTEADRAIPEGGMVLNAAAGYSDSWLESLDAGDEVEFEVVLELPAYGNIRPEIKHLVTGDVRFLRDGVKETEAILWWSGAETIVARSMAGFSEDGSRIVMMCASGGGKTGSTGINYYESADIMRYLGCYNALNLDGGGSATLWTLPKGIVSLIRDGAERPVGNALFFSMDAPVDMEVASVRIADPAARVALYSSYHPVVYGYNSYGQLVDTDVRGFEIESSDNFDVCGDYVVADKPGTHALTVSKDGMTASVALTVEGESLPAPKYPSLVIDRRHKAVPALQATADGLWTDIESTAFEWSSSEPGSIEVDAATGEMRAAGCGSAVVTGRRGDFEVALDVSTEIAESDFMVLDDLFGDDSWTVTEDGLTGHTVAATADGWCLEFDNTRKRGLSIRFDKNIRAYGLPDRAGIDINTNGSRLSSVTMTVEAANGRGTFEIAPAGAVTEGGAMLFEFADAFDTSDYANYPVTFRSLRISPNANQDGSTHLRLGISALGFHYDDYEPSSVSDVSAEASACRLPLTITGNTLRTPAAVDGLELYSADGRLLASCTGAEMTLPAVRGVCIVRAKGSALAAKVCL